MKKDWDDRVIVSVMGVYELGEDFGLCKLLYDSLENIFYSLFKLKNKKFYTQKQIESVFTLILPDITQVNDILHYWNNRQTNAVYQIIIDTFDDLNELLLNAENYEAMANLKRIREYWFSYYKIKIASEQR